MRRLRRAGIALVVPVVLTACGTSLPDKDFSGLEAGSQSSTGGTTAGGSAASSSGVGPAGTSGGGPMSSGRSVTGGSTGSSTAPGVGGGRGPTVRSTTTSSPGAPGSGTHAAGCPGGPNTASDTGVTPTSIKIGILYTGPNNPFAPNQFVVSYDGARAFFGSLDHTGGICGRTVQVDPCDDSGDRNNDINCAHKLIDQDKVFALVGSDVYQYAAAPYVSQQQVPDIGGQPVTGSAYYTYPHLYSILGSLYANNGTPPSVYWGPEGLGIFFKKQLHLSRVGVIHYAQTDSTRGANDIAGYLEAAGVKVDLESLPLAGDASPEVNDMRTNHDQAVFNSLDINGNLNLCRAMQQNNLNVPVVSTISVWNQEVGQDLKSYKCLGNYYAWGGSTSYADTSNPEVRAFRTSYSQYAPGAPLAEWSLQGWAAGMWFSDAATSCGGALTRKCVEAYVNSPKGYSGHGLLDPNTVAFPHHASKPARIKQCYTIVKWRGGGSGTWSTVADHHNTCYTTPVYTYSAN